jgi:hypothetical protein
MRVIFGGKRVDWRATFSTRGGTAHRLVQSLSKVLRRQTVNVNARRIHRPGRTLYIRARALSSVNRVGSPITWPRNEGRERNMLEERPKKGRGWQTPERNGTEHSVPHRHTRNSKLCRFRRAPKTQTGRARRAFRPGGPGARLMSALDGGAYLFTLTPADLNLSDHLEHPSGLYSHVALAEVFGALERTFSGPFYAVCEVGNGSATVRGYLHVHVIAHRGDGPQHIPRGGERCKPVTDAPGLYRYLAKAPEPYSLEAHLDLSAAEVLSTTGRPPRTRRHFLGPSRLTWAATQCTNDLTLSPRGDQPAQRPATPSHPVPPTSDRRAHEHPRQRPSQRAYTASQTPQPQPVAAPHGSPHRRHRTETADAPPSRVSSRVTRTPAPRRPLRLADLFARPVAEPWWRPSARPLHARLNAPERLPAPRPYCGGLDPGPAP